TVTPTTLTFTADNWNTPQTVTVTAPSDPNQLGGEAVLLLETVTSQDPSYDNFPAPTVFVRVADQTVNQGTVVLSTDHLKLTRGGDSDSFTVNLGSQPTGDVTITVAQADPTLPPLPGDGTLTGLPVSTGHDPLGIAPTTLTFTADNWQTPQTVTVS